MKSPSLQLGERLPPFAGLPGVDGKRYSSGDFDTEILVIVFSCNHCPYVQAYEDRVMAFQREFERRARIVAINSNDEANYPDDSFKKMVLRSTERRFNFAYLRDADQKVADAFGATHTPQFFVFDRSRKLRYSGKLDDNWKEPAKVGVRYLRDAVEAVLAGKKVETAETMSIGCTIKWKTA